MRVYIPATPRMLRDLIDAGEQGSLRPVSGLGFALTPSLRESYTAGDDEELSEAAMREAARASLRLLAAQDGDDQSLPLRRAVVVAEVDATARPDLDDAVVQLGGPIAVADIVAVHVDGAQAQDAVSRAVALIDEADLGDEDGELAVGDAEDHDLAWFATQELPFLFELM